MLADVIELKFFADETAPEIAFEWLDQLAEENGVEVFVDADLSQIGNQVTAVVVPASGTFSEGPCGVRRRVSFNKSLPVFGWEDFESAVITQIVIASPLDVAVRLALLKYGEDYQFLLSYVERFGEEALFSPYWKEDFESWMEEVEATDRQWAFLTCLPRESYFRVRSIAHTSSVTLY